MGSLFKYHTRDANGIVKNGEIEALNEDDAVKKLQEQGLVVISVEIAGTGKSEIAKDEVMPQVYLCPKCKSEDVKKVSLVYESEVKATRMSTLVGGIAVDKDGIAGLGGGIASSTGTIQSLLVQRIAPPDKRKYDFHSPWIGLVTLCFILALFFMTKPVVEVVLIIIAILSSIKAHKDTKVNQKNAYLKYEKALHEWNFSWFCNRCGNVFVIEDKT